jgi:hypothetical protein
LGITGGLLILASGIVSAWLGRRTGSFVYEPDPGGHFGHIGVVTGIAAVAIGVAIMLLATRNYETRQRQVIAAVLMMVLGHAGAVAGALIIGTAGMILCHVAGIWLIIKPRS